MGMVLVGSWLLLIGISIPALIMGNKVIRWLVLCSYVVALPYSLYQHASMGPPHDMVWFMGIYSLAVLTVMFFTSITLGTAGWLYYFFRWFFYGNKKK